MLTIKLMIRLLIMKAISLTILITIKQIKMKSNKILKIQFKVLKTKIINLILEVINMVFSRKLKKLQLFYHIKILMFLFRLK